MSLLVFIIGQSMTLAMMFSSIVPMLEVVLLCWT